MRVMRTNRDGLAIEILVDTSQGDRRPGPDARRWCVGIVVDPRDWKLYWTEKALTTPVRSHLWSEHRNPAW